MTRIVQTFTDFGNRKWKDRLEGGKADDKTPEDFPSDDLEIGNKVEREHVSNPDIATEIAMDHLAEDPEYYNKLIASGINDEESATTAFDELKGSNAREKAKKDILSFMEEDDYDDEEDIEDFEDDEEYDEDELGTDKVDFEDDEQIFDEEEPKNKRIVMEKSLKNYKSFLKESANEEVVEEPKEPVVTDPGPERKYSKENKYKFQIQYDKKIVDKLNDYNFTYYVPEGEKEAGNPTKDTHNIIIDILNLNYAIVDNDYPDIRQIDASRLKHLLDNL